MTYNRSKVENPSPLNITAPIIPLVENDSDLLIRAIDEYNAPNTKR